MILDVLDSCTSLAGQTRVVWHVKVSNVLITNIDVVSVSFYRLLWNSYSVFHLKSELLPRKCSRFSFVFWHTKKTYKTKSEFKVQNQNRLGLKRRFRNATLRRVNVFSAQAQATCRLWSCDLVIKHNLRGHAPYLKCLDNGQNNQFVSKWHCCNECWIFKLDKHAYIMKTHPSLILYSFFFF